MKHYKKTVVPEKVVEFQTHVTCDMCGVKIERECYEVEDIEISRKTGYSYPEGGSGEKVEVDLCSNCFENELIPWLTSKGVVPTTTEWDY